MSRSITKQTKSHVHPAKTQICNPPSLISLRCVFYGQPRGQWFFVRTTKTLCRLGGSPGWSESSLGTQLILLVLLCIGSNEPEQDKTDKITSAQLWLSCQEAFEACHEKICLCHMQTTKMWINREVWPPSLLFTAQIVQHLLLLHLKFQDFS